MYKEIILVDILKLDDDIKQKLRSWRNQEFVRNNMFNQEIITKEEHEAFLTKLTEDSRIKIFVAYYNGEPFGVLNYHLREEDSLEFGYYLIDEKHISSGLGAILEYILLNHAFDGLKVKKVYCRTLTHNKKTINLHKKFGFINVKILRNIARKDDECLDACMQAIYPDIWKNERKKIEKVIKYLIPLEKIDSIKLEVNNG